MAVAYHTHTFEIPTATNAEIAAGVVTDKVATPAALGSAAAADASAFLQPGDIGTDIQAHSPNLDEVAAVNPGATGLAILADATVDEVYTSLTTALWTDGTNRTMKERSRRVCHLDDFTGADPTGDNLSTTALTNWINQATTSLVKAQFGAGKYALDASLPVIEGITIEGETNGVWRASPFSFWSADAADDPFVSSIILVGTGAKTQTQDWVTANRQNGFHRANPSRNYMTANDADFELLDMTNRDASGATRATLKSCSAGLIIGSANPVSRPTRLRNFRVVTSCIADAETLAGVRGYGNLTAVVPFADWDFGMIIRNSWMMEVENVNVVGYYRQRGVLMTPAATGSSSEGQGEHLHWNGGYIQGGLEERGGDNWPIIAKAATTLDVRWTSSHRFTTTGTLKFTSGSDVTYTGLTFVGGSPDILRFTGCSSTASITIGTSAIKSTANSGVSHSQFSNMYIADQGYSTRIEGPNTALGSQATPFRAAIAISGEPSRAMKFDNVTVVPGGPVAFHFGWAKHVEMWKCYTEPKAWKLTVGGADQTQGSLFIAGPQAAFNSEVFQDDGTTIESWGMNFASYVNRYPLVTPAASYRLSTMTDVFNPEYYRDSRGLFIAGTDAVPDQATNAFYIIGLNGENTGLRGRDAAGVLREIITGFGSSGNSRVAGNLVVKLLGGADLTGDFTATGQSSPAHGVGFPEFTAAQIIDRTSIVNLVSGGIGKKRGLVIFDGTNFRLMVAAGALDNSSWRVVDNSATITPV